MTKFDIVRAWKDEDYCQSLSAAERAQLPENPVGLIELNDGDLNGAAGGTTFPFTVTIGTADLDCSLMYSCITLGCTVTITYEADAL